MKYDRAMGALRIAWSLAMILMLGAMRERSKVPTPPLPQLGMAGRWMLSAPNAPPCGMEFEGEPGRQDGVIRPDGGCPGTFLHEPPLESLAQDTLTIVDDENKPLAELKLAEGGFAGQSTAGMPVTLAR